MMTLSFFLYIEGNDDDAFDQLKLLKSRTSLVSVRLRPHYAVLPITDDTRQGWELRQHGSTFSLEILTTIR